MVCFVIVLWWKMVAVMTFLFLCVVVEMVASSAILVSPSMNQFIANNSMENVTFTCDVRGPSESLSRRAVWRIQERQIENDPIEENPTRRTFESIGVFINVVDDGVTEVVITEMARMSFLATTPDITVQCSSFSSDGDVPVTEVGAIITVTTFG